jgi:hypothetical protein
MHACLCHAYACPLAPRHPFVLSSRQCSKRSIVYCTSLFSPAIIHTRARISLSRGNRLAASALRLLAAKLDLALGRCTGLDSWALLESVSVGSRRRGSGRHAPGHRQTCRRGPCAGYRDTPPQMRVRRLPRSSRSPPRTVVPPSPPRPPPPCAALPAPSVPRRVRVLLELWQLREQVGRWRQRRSRRRRANEWVQARARVPRRRGRSCFRRVCSSAAGLRAHERRRASCVGVRNLHLRQSPNMYIAQVRWGTVKEGWARRG